MSDVKNRAQDYLKKNNGVEKVFSTSDGELFTEEMYARQHAAVLEDKDVVKHVKEVVVEVPAAPATQVKVETKNENGDVVREYNQTVDAPKITDAPGELEGKADVITEGLQEQAKAVLENAKPDPAEVTDPATQGTAKKATSRTKK